MLEQVEYLARRDYTTRSGILRTALVEYMKLPGNSKSAKNTQDFSEIMAEHPYVNPNDTELLQFFKDMKEHNS